MAFVTLALGKCGGFRGSLMGKIPTLGSPRRSCVTREERWREALELILANSVL